MGVRKQPDPYPGYQDDLKEVKNYFNYLYMVSNRTPEATKILAEEIRTWKRDVLGKEE